MEVHSLSKPVVVLLAVEQHKTLVLVAVVQLVLEQTSALLEWTVVLPMELMLVSVLMVEKEDEEMLLDKIPKKFVQWEKNSRD